MRDLHQLTKTRKECTEELFEYLLNNDRIKDYPELAQNLLFEKSFLENYDNPNLLNKSTKQKHDFIMEIAGRDCKYQNVQDLLDGLVVVKEKQVNKNVCPISMKSIQNLWISECGHRFEKTSVLNENGKVRFNNCPVLGCNKRLMEHKERPGNRNRM